MDAPPIKLRSHYERVKRNMKPLSHYFRSIEPPPENVEGKRMLARIRDLLPLKQEVSIAMPPESEMTVERTRESLNVTRVVRMALDGSLAVHRASRSLTGDRAALEIELHVTRYAAEQGFGPTVLAARIIGEGHAKLEMLLEYLKNDGSYEDFATLPETLKRAAQCGVIHCELLPEHVRHARGRGCFLIAYDPRLVHVVGASDADECLDDGVGAAVMARQLLLLYTKAMAKGDEWQRGWPVNIDAWHALRQLAKRHKPEPLTAVKMRADDPDQPGALVSPFSPCEASLESTLSQKACFF